MSCQNRFEQLSDIDVNDVDGNSDYDDIGDDEDDHGTEHANDVDVANAAEEIPAKDDQNPICKLCNTERVPQPWNKLCAECFYRNPSYFLT